MNQQTVEWQIPLHAQPTLLFMGTGHHGQFPIERYRLGDIWCIHLYHYDGEMRLGDQSFPIHPGHVSITPPFVTLEHHFSGKCMHHVGHFALPTKDGHSIAIPAMQNAGAVFADIEAMFVEAIGWFPTQARRAEVRVWDLLWRLAAPAGADSANALLHPAIEKTVQSIELRLGDPLGVADLAEEVNISHSHLTRLFHQAVGTSIISYIVERRVQRAQHLLTYSTQPIKTIAAQVGIPDLHQFNKTIRRALGKAPSAVRADGFLPPAPKD